MDLEKIVQVFLCVQDISSLLRIKGCPVYEEAKDVPIENAEEPCYR
jgi:hypothetical protein